MTTLGKQVDIYADFWSAYEIQMNGVLIPNLNREPPSRDVLFAIGGEPDGDGFSIERFCPKSNSWSITETSFRHRPYFAAARLNNSHVYIIGGVQNGWGINEVTPLLWF